MPEITETAISRAEPRPVPPPDGAPPAPGNRGDPEIRLVTVASALVRRWRLVVGVPFLAALVTAIISLVLPHRFVSTTSFTPESPASAGQLPGALSGLASQFGISVGGGSNSPRFYADVLLSRTIIDQILRSSFPDFRTGDPTDSALLPDLLDVQGETEALRLDRARRLLRNTATTSVNYETNIVVLAVEAPDPGLAADVANLFVAKLNQFNLQTRSSSAGEMRTFIEGRLVDAQAALDEAERALRSFLEQNRQFRGSPQLQFEHDRLVRNVTIKQEVLTTLARQYEEARIQEVNDTPVISIIDDALPPERRSYPRRKIMVMTAFFGAAAFVLVLVATLEFIAFLRRSDGDEYGDLADAWDDARRSVRFLLPRKRSRPS